MTTVYQAGERGERTRVRILEAAELLFAENGFSATRLEDVAARVGLRRAGIVYYFRDKRELYGAVIEAVFGQLAERLAAASSSTDSPSRGVEAMVDAWVSFAAERPSVARLYLREVANASATREPQMAKHIHLIFEVAQKTIEAGQQQGVFGEVNTMHFLSVIAGATLIFVAAMPRLRLDPEFNPLSPNQIRTHRREILQMAQRLLDVRKPPEAGPEQAVTRTRSARRTKQSAG